MKKKLMLSLPLILMGSLIFLVVPSLPAHSYLNGTLDWSISPTSGPHGTVISVTSIDRCPSGKGWNGIWVHSRTPAGYESEEEVFPLEPDGSWSGSITVGNNPSSGRRYYAACVVWSEDARIIMYGDHSDAYKWQYFFVSSPSNPNEASPATEGEAPAQSSPASESGRGKSAAETSDGNALPSPGAEAQTVAQPLPPSEPADPVPSQAESQAQETESAASFQRWPALIGLLVVLIVVALVMVWRRRRTRSIL